MQYTKTLRVHLCALCVLCVQQHSNKDLITLQKLCDHPLWPADSVEQATLRLRPSGFMEKSVPANPIALIKQELRQMLAVEQRLKIQQRFSFKSMQLERNLTLMCERGQGLLDSTSPWQHFCSHLK